MQNFIPSVDSSLKVLEFLANEETQSSTLSEISSSLSINKSTCLRILKTMAQRDFVHYDEKTKQYKLGSYLIALGTRASQVNNYLNIAISFLPLVCKEINQTVVLAKRTDKYNMAYIAKEESESLIRLTVSTGNIFPIIGGAAGKIYMAYLDQKEVEDIINYYIEEGKLPSYTHQSITEPSKYIESLKEVNKLGMAETDSEHTPGIYAVSCPIFNSKNEVILSIAAFIPSYSTNSLDLKTIRERIHYYSNLISEEVSIYV